MRAVIGLGGAGANTVAYLQEVISQIDLKYLHINNDERALIEYERDEKLLLPLRQRQPGFKVHAFDFGPWLYQALADCHSCYVICGMGGSCADALRDLLSACRSRVPEVFLVAYLPFSFENSRLQASLAQDKWIAQELTCLSGHLFIDNETERTNYQDQSLTSMFNGLYGNAKIFIEQSGVRTPQCKTLQEREDLTRLETSASNVEPGQREMTTEQVGFFAHHYENYFMTFKTVCIIESVDDVEEHISSGMTEGKKFQSKSYDISGSLLVPHVGDKDMLFSATFWVSFKDRKRAEEQKRIFDKNISLYWLVEGHFFVNFDGGTFNFCNPKLQLIYPPYSLSDTAYDLDHNAHDT